MGVAAIGNPHQRLIENNIFHRRRHGVSRTGDGKLFYLLFDGISRFDFELFLSLL
jgi:hypothetical protein